MASRRAYYYGAAGGGGPFLLNAYPDFNVTYGTPVTVGGGNFTSTTPTDVLTHTQFTSVTGVTVNSGSGAVTFNPVGKAIYSTWPITVRVSNQFGVFADDTMVATVQPAVPTSTAIPSLTRSPLTAVSVNLATYFSTINPADSLTYSATGMPSSLSIAGSTISGTVVAGNLGSHTITATATNTFGQSTSRSFTLTVAYQAPVSSGYASVSGTEPVSFSRSNPFSTPNPGDSLTYTATALPAGVSRSGGALSGTVAAGSYSITVTATSVLSGLSVSSTLSLSIAADPYPVGYVHNGGFATVFDLASNPIIYGGWINPGSSGSPPLFIGATATLLSGAPFAFWDGGLLYIELNAPGPVGTTWQVISAGDTGAPGPYALGFLENVTIQRIS